MLDSHGQPVKGLGREDFEVLLGKRPSPIKTFDTYTADSARPPQPALPREAGAPLSNISASSKADLVVIVLLDFLNTDLKDRRRARQQALDFFARELRPGQWVAAYGLGYRLVPLQSLTNDAAALKAQAEKAMTGLERLPRNPPESVTMMPRQQAQANGTDGLSEFFQLQNARQQFVSSQRDRAARTLDAFRQLAGAFSGVPGKKILLWITGDASPLNPSLMYQVLRDAPHLEAVSLPSSELARTFGALNNANISIFPVDARGVKNTGMLQADREATHTEFQSLRHGSQPEDAVPYAGVADMREGEAANATLAMQTCAAETGGDVLSGNNDLAALLHRASAAWQSYYVLGVAPPSDAGSAAAAYIPIHVNVKRRGVRVFHRQGFTPAAVLQRRDPREAIQETLNSPLDSTAVPLKLTLSGPAESRAIPFMLQIGVSGDVDVTIAIFTENEGGAIVARAGEQLSGKLPPAQPELRYDGRFVVPTPGPHRGRLIVRDNRSGAVGSITVTALENKVSRPN